MGYISNMMRKQRAIEARQKDTEDRAFGRGKYAAPSSTDTREPRECAETTADRRERTGKRFRD